MKNKPNKILAVLLALVFDPLLAFRFAQGIDENAPHPAYSRWYGLVGIACAVFALVWGLRAFGYEPFKIPSESMLPTLPVGARIVIKKWGYGHYTSYGIGLRGQTLSAPLARGDIVVFDYAVDHSTAYIKRLIGLPGDTVAYHDNQLTINGKQWPRRKIGTFIPDGSANILSRFTEANDSADSRYWGFVPADHIVGKVVKKWRATR